MLYENIKTGVVINSPCLISGGDWVLQSDIKKQTESKAEEVIDKEPEDMIEEDDNLKKLTKEDIMQELDAFGIEYDKKATKAELYDLMMNHGE